MAGLGRKGDVGHRKVFCLCLLCSEKSIEKIPDTFLCWWSIAILLLGQKIDKRTPRMFNYFLIFFFIDNIFLCRKKDQSLCTCSLVGSSAKITT